jgi:hypothetical protein
MSHKIPFRDGVNKRMRRGAPNEEDADLRKISPDFASSMAYWRGRYSRFNDPMFNPSSRAVKDSLAALVKLPLGKVEAATASLDPATEAHINRGAALSGERSLFSLRRIVGGRVVIAKPELVQAWAREALATFPKEKGNTRKISGLDHQFAAALVGWWRRLYPDISTELPNPCEWARSDDQPETSFLNWAWEMFSRVGRVALREHKQKPLKPVSLVRILKKAINEVDLRT